MSVLHARVRAHESSQVHAYGGHGRACGGRGHAYGLCDRVYDGSVSYACGQNDHAYVHDHVRESSLVRACGDCESDLGSALPHLCHPR